MAGTKEEKTIFLLGDAPEEAARAEYTVLSTLSTNSFGS